MSDHEALKLTCLSCRVTFVSADLQRDHFKSEWHRYNLKRKVAELPPITKDVFEKIEAQFNNVDGNKQQSNLDKSKKNEQFYCKSCRKHFNKEKAFDQHNRSKRHVDSQTPNKQQDQVGSKEIKNEDQIDLCKKVEETNYDSGEDDEDWESVDSEEPEEGDGIPANQCLFCNISSSTAEENLTHMTSNHSFFFPDAEFLTDIDGLLVYLGEKVGCGFKCLWCCDSGKRFRSVESVQKHMIDKGHTKLKFEGVTLAEYSDFYDYTSSYPDKEAADPEEEVSPVLIDDDDWQLTLPSGAVIGHRLLFRYYKQNLKPVSEKPSKSGHINKMLAQYRALGWTGTSGVAAVQRARDITYIQKVKAAYQLKVAKKHNKILQPHFRSQIGF